EIIDCGIIEVNKNNNIPTGDEIGSRNYLENGTIPFIRTSDITNLEIRSNPQQFTSEEIYQKYKDKQDIKPYDILLVKDGKHLGQDQFRGWFNSSLITSVILTGKAPYQQVLSHGFVVDEKGHKMSKSLGNVLDPEDLIKQFGQRNKGNLANLSPNLKNEKDLELELHLVDYYILNKLEKLTSESRKNYGEYNFNPIYTSLLNFCINDLSSFYFEISKDSLYCDSLSSLRRQQITTTLYYLLQGLLKTISPIFPFLAEEVYQNIPFRFGFAGQESVHLANYSSTLSLSPSMGKKTAIITNFFLPLRQDVYQALEKARQEKIINTNSQAHLIIFLKEKNGLDYSQLNLEDLLLVAKVEIKDQKEDGV
ncbi:2664_t:CDS:2, partial [Cetraspora pellucida]